MPKLLRQNHVIEKFLINKQSRQARFFQIRLNYSISNSSENKFDVLSICCACKMYIYFFMLIPIFL